MARLRGLSPEAWEEQVNARETRARVEVVRTAPRTMFLEITGRCPIECLMCARRYRNWKYGDLDERIFAKLERVFPRVGMVVLGGFGEPLAAASFDSRFERLLGLGARVALQTSGYRLTEERAVQLTRGLRHLHISMDSPEEATYRSIRPRIAFQEVTARIRQMAALKREGGSPYPTIHVVFVAMRRNIEQLPAMVDLVAELGADNLTVQYMVAHGEEVREESLFYHKGLANRMLGLAEARAKEIGLNVTLPARFGEPHPPSPAPRAERGQTETARESGHPRGEVRASDSSTPRLLDSSGVRCTDPWQVAFVRWNGEVHPCCYAPSNVVMGSLAERSFWEIWNGPAYRELRRRVNSADPPDYCRTCTVGRLCGVDDERAHVVLGETSPASA
ncbi:MAG: SPASM domain-containing protein [Armatimonadota bacterium]